MNNKYYQSPKSTWLLRQFWKIAGADANLLERCTYSDQIKHFCIGVLILSTGFFAFVSGTYAFYSIIHLEVEKGLTNLSVLYICVSLLFGLIWGFFIYTFNRFLYISSGNGDGTEAITFKELIASVPKISVSIVLSVSISLPIAVSLLDYNPQNTIVPFQANFSSKIAHFGEKLIYIAEKNPIFLALIILFFVVIQLTPIIIKLMIQKGPFEFMEEKISQLHKAEMGIEVIYDYYEDRKGSRRDKVVNHPVEFKIKERKKIMEAQRRINDKIIKEYLANLEKK